MTDNNNHSPDTINSNSPNNSPSNNSPSHIHRASPRIAIIGGGLTGLITAHLLEQQLNTANDTDISNINLDIHIFEKSAGVGRLATRYRKAKLTEDTKEGLDTSNRQWQFDFGAQFFTAKSPAFSDYLRPFIASGIVEPWLARVATIHQAGDDLTQASVSQWDTSQPRYISSPKMTTFGRDIAKRLTHTTIHYKTRIAPLQCPQQTTPASQTTLYDTDGHSLGEFDWVVCTAPQMQAIELIAPSDFTHKDKLAWHKMLACYSLMLGWDTADDLPDSLKNPEWDVLNIDPSSVQDNAQDSVQGNTQDNAHIKKDSEHPSCLGKVFIEHPKPSRDNILPSVTIHASNTWSEKHVDDELAQVQASLLAAAQCIFGWNDDTQPTHVDCHRWRYAATSVANPACSGNDHKPAHAVYVDDDKRWIVTGDWCGEGRIESCYSVATQVANYIVNSMTAN